MSVNGFERDVLQTVTIVQGEIGDRFVADQQIADMVAADLARVQDALDDLASEGYVEVESADPGYTVRITEEGRRALLEQ